MAKVGFWLKGANGKLAGATVYQSNGETLMREVVKPTDAKTTGQVLQRIVMHTVMSSYSLMKEICDHSFEGIKKGQDTMAYFMKQNVQFCREKIAKMQSEGVSAYGMYNFIPLGVKGFTPNQYLVAMGSLPQITTAIKEESSHGYISGFAENTYENVIKTLGLTRGDQLTFCIVHATGTGMANKEFKFCRVILDPTNADGTSAPLSSAFIVDGKINLPSARNEGDFYFEFNSSKQIEFAIELGVGGIANCVIASRKGSDGNWLRSTAYLAYIEYGQSYNLGECLDMAKEGAANPIVTTNALYLNNAGTNAGASSEGGSTPVVPVDPTPTPGAASISSVRANNVNITRGTQGMVTLPNGTTLPHSINVVVNAANADGKKVAVLAGNTFLAEATVASGVATIAANVNTGIIYKVCWSEEEEYTETSYNFTVTVNSTPGGGGNGDEG